MSNQRAPADGRDAGTPVQVDDDSPGARGARPHLMPPGAAECGRTEKRG